MSNFEYVNASGICRKTGEETTIRVGYENDHHLEPKYNKQRLEIRNCPNGGCNNCPIYNSMPDEKIF